MLMGCYVTQYMKVRCDMGWFGWWFGLWLWVIVSTILTVNPSEGTIAHAIVFHLTGVM